MRTRFRKVTVVGNTFVASTGRRFLQLAISEDVVFQALFRSKGFGYPPTREAKLWNLKVHLPHVGYANQKVPEDSNEDYALFIESPIMARLWFNFSVESCPPHSLITLRRKISERSRPKALSK